MIKHNKRVRDRRGCNNSGVITRLQQDKLIESMGTCTQEPYNITFKLRCEFCYSISKIFDKFRYGSSLNAISNQLGRQSRCS